MKKKGVFNENPPSDSGKTSFYDEKFYEDQWRNSYKSAEIILPIVLNSVKNITSACDFGCGVGTWLSVAQKLGITDILGVDGNWVDTNKLKIPKNCFRMFDLEKPVILEKKIRHSVFG